MNQALLGLVAAWGFPHAHQGAGIRKLGPDVWESRAGLRLRLLFKTAKAERELILFEVGNHDDIRRVLKGR